MLLCPLLSFGDSGQESAGLVVLSHEGKVNFHKGVGLVEQASWGGRKRERQRKTGAGAGKTKKEKEKSK